MMQINPSYSRLAVFVKCFMPTRGSSFKLLRQTTRENIQPQSCDLFERKLNRALHGSVTAAVIQHLRRSHIPIFR